MGDDQKTIDEPRMKRLEPFRRGKESVFQRIGGVKGRLRIGIKAQIERRAEQIVLDDPLAVTGRETRLELFSDSFGELLRSHRKEIGRELRQR